ncbi:hypothetical protein Goshw_006462 [Gossypium schwendimanii]|uniref:Uncharacterized protein n=1 Tax=Gossypium schwendimanii TaxID=34291 RepID=A0A7J9MTQ0_GOSSC|nr:hypothetical protein [Gossypium schwendimanii]
MDTRIEMPAEPLNFMEEFDSALHEVQNQAQGSTLPQTTKPLIQRVSPHLLDMKADFQKCFEPRLVALGPFHHDKPKFQRAERSKLKFAARFVHDSGTNRDDLLDKIKAQIDDLRKCYKPEDVEAYDNDKLARVLFVDGCAVLCAVRYGVEGKFDELNTKADLLIYLQPMDTVIEMPAEPLNFMEEEMKEFDSALHEVQNQEQQQAQGSTPPQTTKPLIQRVSPHLLDMKADFQKCFEPRLVALGPLHHGNPRFQRAEQSKLKFAARFVHVSGTNRDDLFDKVKAQIDDLRKCYKPEDIEAYDNDKLAWMLFVDGCAVLCAVRYGMEGKFDELNTKADLLVFAQLDLFLLENQLPYKLLKILIGSAKDPQIWEQSITDFIDQNLMTNIYQKRKHVDDDRDYAHLLERLRDELLTGEEMKINNSKIVGDKDYAHLLERLRDELLTGEEMKIYNSKIGGILLSCGDSRKHRKTFRSIKELKESGIHVKPSTTNNLKDISFYCNFLGTLMMPRLLVDDSTASKFLNLVALEMCRDFKNDFEVTSYLCFMDTLIDSADDVKELRVTGILHNYFGSDEEVANLFNKMSRDLVPDQGRYENVIKEIHKYCNNPWTDALAQVYYTHFSTPWTVLAFIGAIIGLLFSAIQAYFSLPQNRNG